MAQAVAVADTLSAQSNYDPKEDKIKIPGRDGNVFTCDPSVLSDFNGKDLVHLALATEPLDGYKPFYWDEALLASAVKLCRVP